MSRDERYAREASQGRGEGGATDAEEKGGKTGPSRDRRPGATGCPGRAPKETRREAGRGGTRREEERRPRGTGSTKPQGTQRDTREEREGNLT